jgi:hypothetical protein
MGEFEKNKYRNIFNLWVLYVSLSAADDGGYSFLKNYLTKHGLYNIFYPSISLGRRFEEFSPIFTILTHFCLATKFSRSVFFNE